MPVSVPVPDKASGDIFTEAMWDSYIRDNINKLLDRGHRVLTVAQFTALTSPEGTKGSVSPDEAYVEVDSTNGVLWHFAYESGEATYKWRFLGGPPLYSYVATAETTTSGTYAALTTAGPSIALPRAGDYDVSHGCQTTKSGGTSNDSACRMSYDIGGTGAVDTDCVVAEFSQFDTAARVLEATPSRFKRKTALTSVTLTAKYKSEAGDTAMFSERWMKVTPVRVRHDA